MKTNQINDTYFKLKKQIDVFWSETQTIRKLNKYYLVHPDWFFYKLGYNKYHLKMIKFTCASTCEVIDTKIINHIELCPWYLIEKNIWKINSEFKNNLINTSKGKLLIFNEMYLNKEPETTPIYLNNTPSNIENQQFTTLELKDE